MHGHTSAHRAEHKVVLAEHIGEETALKAQADVAEQEYRLHIAAAALDGPETEHVPVDRDEVIYAAAGVDMAHRAPEAIGLARFQSLRVDVIAVRVVPVALHDGKPSAGQHDVLGHVAFGLDGAFQLAVRSVDKYLLLAVCIYQTSSGFKFAEHAPFLHEFQPGEVYLSQQLAVVGAQLQNGQALALADAFEPDTLFGSGDLLYLGQAVKLK